MASGQISRYDAIQNHRARQRDFAELAEQRSAARKEAAQRTMAQSDATRNTMVSRVADAGAGMTKLTEMAIRTRIADEAKADAKAKAKSAAAARYA